MLVRFTQLARDLVELIYPVKCLICDGSQTSPQTHLLCETCLAARASQPVPDISAVINKYENPATAKDHLDAVLAGWPYDDAMRLVIHALKYRRRASLSRVLGALLAQRLHDSLQQEIPRAVLVPVPLHRRRQHERGFNQSLLLAQAIAAAWNITVLPRAIKRVKFTQSQAKLDATARKENVDGAFAPARNFRFEDRTIFLVDDVFTTGATMNACAAALKSAGAVRVIGLALAKPG